jgi:hypothetical protein
MKKATLKKTKSRVIAAPDRKISVAGKFTNSDPAKKPVQDNPAGGHDKTIVAIPLAKTVASASSTAGGVWLRTVPLASR